MRVLTLIVCLLAPAALVPAQEKSAVPAAPDKQAATVAPDNPFSNFNKAAYGYLKNVVLRSAEKMPQENYNFKPTEACPQFRANPRARCRCIVPVLF